MLLPVSLLTYTLTTVPALHRESVDGAADTTSDHTSQRAHLVSQSVSKSTVSDRETDLQSVRRFNSNANVDITERCI